MNNKVPAILFYSEIVVLCIVLLCCAFKVNYVFGFEEAQEYTSKRGFDIAWNDCDVFVDERYITQTVGNVLKWADNNPVEQVNTDAFIEKVESFLNKKDDRDSYTIGYIKRHLKEIIKEMGL